MAAILLLCVARLAWIGLHGRSPTFRLLTLEEYTMSLSAKAQALADELATLPALYQAKEDAAVKVAFDAGAASVTAAPPVVVTDDTDLDGLKPVVDGLVSSAEPPVVTVQEAPAGPAEPVAEVDDPLAPAVVVEPVNPLAVEA